jgi:hypothetical protein
MWSVLGRVQTTAQYKSVFGTSRLQLGFAAEQRHSIFREDIIMGAGTVVLISALLALLCGAGYFAYLGLTLPGEAMPTDGYIALGLGVGFSLIVGFGLMALVFYSSRHGYDEPPRFRDDR